MLSAINKSTSAPLTWQRANTLQQTLHCRFFQTLALQPPKALQEHTPRWLCFLWLARREHPVCFAIGKSLWKSFLTVLLHRELKRKIELHYVKGTMRFSFRKTNAKKCRTYFLSCCSKPHSTKKAASICKRMSHNSKVLQISVMFFTVASLTKGSRSAL